MFGIELPVTRTAPKVDRSADPLTLTSLNPMVSSVPY